VTADTFINSISNPVSQGQIIDANTGIIIMVVGFILIIAGIVIIGFNRRKK